MLVTGRLAVPRRPRAAPATIGSNRFAPARLAPGHMHLTFLCPNRKKKRAREALQVEERVVRWIGEQGEDGVPAAAPEVGAGAERDVGAGAEADVVSDASSATGGMY